MPLDGTPVWAMQNQFEFELFYSWIRNRRPERVLEIGSFCGGTLWKWAQLPSVTHLTSIDLPVPEGHKEYDRVRQARSEWPHWFAHLEFQDIVGDSKDDDVWSQLTTTFDLIFIDGDHTYEGVRNDWLRSYFFGSGSGAVVAFHDTVHQSPGVTRFVSQLKTRLVSVEFSAPAIDGGVGITAVILP